MDLKDTVEADPDVEQLLGVLYCFVYKQDESFDQRNALASKRARHLSANEDMKKPKTVQLLCSLILFVDICIRYERIKFEISIPQLLGLCPK